MHESYKRKQHDLNQTKYGAQDTEELYIDSTSIYHHSQLKHHIQ